MAYDAQLADRIRAHLADEFDIVEKHMFGGLAFLVRGHLTVAASRRGLLVRTDPEVEEQTLAKPGVSPMSPDPSRRMPGWVVVESARVAEDADLHRWIDESLDFVAGLPPKP